MNQIVISDGAVNLLRRLVGKECWSELLSSDYSPTDSAVLGELIMVLANCPVPASTTQWAAIVSDFVHKGDESSG